jgi:hypothetical protein
MANCKLRAEFTLTRQAIVSCDTCNRRDFADASEECKDHVEEFKKHLKDNDPFSQVLGGISRG